MAANLAGMFDQLNKGIQGFSGMAQPSIDMMSQGFGGVAATGAGMMGMEDVDPMSFMNEGGKQLEGQKQLSQQDPTTLEGMKKSAMIYQQMGDPEKAMQMTLMAQKKQQEQMTYLQEGNEEIQKGSARTSAAGLAMQRGDKEAHAAIVGGYLSPEEYIAKVLDEKDPEPGDGSYTLGEGELHFDENNEIVARGPAKPMKVTNDNTDPPPVFVEKASFVASVDAAKARVLAGNAGMLISKIDSQLAAGSGESGGFIATGEEAMRKFVGTPDDVSNLRIEYHRLRNSEAVANLPPGSASDADVRLALQGWPGDNAPLSQIRAFISGMQKLQIATAEYNEFVADFIGEKRSTLGVSRAWRESTAGVASGTTSFNDLPQE